MSNHNTDDKAPILTVKGVTKRFHKLTAVNNVSLEVQRGEVLSIVGSSGSGKSTLLRCINHLETIDSGEIRLRNELIGFRVNNRKQMVELAPRKLARQRRCFGMVFQGFHLFPHMTARENVMEAPVKVQGLKRSQASAKAEGLLASVGLTDNIDRYPHQLSGGQQQRVAIARALCMDPEIMLFDEPTSALDPELVGEVLEVMKQLAEAGTTMVVVTHEIEFARDVSDNLALMHHGEVVDYGDPHHVINHSESDRARAFFAPHRKNQHSAESNSAMSNQ